MGKLATKTITANSLFPKRFTLLSSVGFLGTLHSVRDLMGPVSKLTFIAVWAEPHFRIVLTHFSFEFADVCLHGLGRIVF